MTESTALTLPQRAAVALGDSANEARLHELAAQSAGILIVNSVAGRTEAHRAGMVLLKARTSIEKAADVAVADAKGFVKAVSTKRVELIAIIQPEEVRVMALRDGWDEDEQARKDLAIQAERARTDAIKALIADIRQAPVAALLLSSDKIAALLDGLMENEPGDEFAEFIGEALKAHGESMGALDNLKRIAEERELAEWEAKQAREAEAARQLAERQADDKRRADEAAQLAKDRAELEAQRKANELESAARAKAAKALQDQAEANLKALADAQAERDAEFQREKDEHAASVKRQADELAAQKAAADARDRQAVIDEAHGEGLDDNAAWDAAELASLDAAFADQIAEALLLDLQFDIDRASAAAGVSLHVADAETADEQAIRCRATAASAIIGALTDAADAINEEYFSIDTEAIAWAYEKLLAYGAARVSMENALMMDRLNLMIMGAA